MRYLWLVWLAAIVGGCIPYSNHPLTDPGDAGPDPAVLGTWFLHQDDETVFLHLGIDDTTRGLRVVMVEIQKDGAVKTSELVGHTSKLTNGTYMNLRWDRPADHEAGYLFVKYRVTGERFGLGLIRSDTVEKAIREGLLPGTIEETRVPMSIRITAPSKTVRAYIERHDGELFEEFQWLQRWTPVLPAAGKTP